MPAGYRPWTAAASKAALTEMGEAYATFASFIAAGEAPMEAGGPDGGVTTRIGATKLDPAADEVFGFIWGEVVNDTDSWIGNVLLSVYFLDGSGAVVG